MLGLDTCVDRVLIYLLFKLLIGEFVELGAGYSFIGALYDTEFHGDRHGGVLMVAGYHYRANTGTAAFPDSSEDLGADGVDHAAESYEYQILLKYV